VSAALKRKSANSVRSLKPTLPRGASGLPSGSRETLQADVIRALVAAVDGEHRFGNREDVRADLNARWAHAIALLERYLE
jgi:hypothetical protein